MSRPDKTKNAEMWMPLLVDKYLGDTTHLNTEQHGAYLLMLMTMWKRAGSLPNDEQQLASIAKLAPQRWRAHRSVLLSFFTVDEEGHLQQKRLAEELVRANANIEQRRAAGKASAAKRAGQREADSEGNGNGNESSTAVATSVPTGGATEAQRTVERNARPIPIPSSSLRSEESPHAPQGAESDPPEPTAKRKRRAPVVLTGEGMGLFAEFWAAYPRKAAKPRAMEAFLRLAPTRELVDRMLAAIKAQGLSAKYRGSEKRFVPHPTSWLNAARWEDDVDANPETPSSLPSTGVQALLDRPSRPAWALEAGFRTIFEAENEGCYEHNAGQFRDGKRVASR